MSFPPSYPRSLAGLSTILIASTLASGLCRGAEITLPPIYADHIVFQTGRPIVISGSVTPASETVQVDLAGRQASAQPSLFGQWRAVLDPIDEPGLGHTLTISVGGAVAESLENVALGDVWLCGGQSNMEWDMVTIGANADIQAADYPEVRLLEVRKVSKAKPDDDVPLEQTWTPCTPTSVRNFSAVGFFFGREVHQETGRPIGLIQSAWGGSRIETWIPNEALRSNPYAENVASRSYGSVQHRPSICYNAMIHGLAPLAIRGILWYQGESNESQANEYRSLHETLINAWRYHWQNPQLPFYFVQLANYAPGNHWERLREAQTQTLAVPHTGMAVTIDIGNSTDIHPRNKQDVGKRLAAIALADAYGQDRVDSGPRFRSASTDGRAITVQFDSLGSGLVSTAGSDRVLGFEALYAGGTWRKAAARIVDDTIVLPGSIFNTDPQGVRYAWASDPEVSLMNTEGFPAAPFRLEAFEQSYDRWRDQLTGAARQPHEDANGDGESNFMEYAAAGKRPHLSALPDGRALLTFHRRATASDVEVVLEQALDLHAWSPVWTSESSEGSGFEWTQKMDWGAVMTEQFAVTVPQPPEETGYYRIRYRGREE